MEGLDTKEFERWDAVDVFLILESDVGIWVDVLSLDSTLCSGFEGCGKISAGVSSGDSILPSRKYNCILSIVLLVLNMVLYRKIERVVRNQVNS